MSGIAEIMLRQGYSVQGSDAKAGTNTSAWKCLGPGFSSDMTRPTSPTPSVIVFSSAIKADNIEMVAGRRARTPLVRRAEMLAELMRLRFSIAVAGTHGKTTTTSMIAALLDAGGLDPTVVNGGLINAYGANAKVGDGEWIVAEADESDGTFLRVAPHGRRGHQYRSRTLGSLRRFRRRWPTHSRCSCRKSRFTASPPSASTIRMLQEMASRVENRRLITYGTNPQAEVRALNIGMGAEGASFDVQIQGVDGAVTILEQMTLPMAGRHICPQCPGRPSPVARTLGVADQAVRRGLATFAGVRRRFTPVGVTRGIRIIDDYGHHPVEIASVLAAAPRGLRWTGHRGGSAASLHAPARSISGFLPLLQRR